jgi:hypothetical protein
MLDMFYSPVVFRDSSESDQIIRTSRVVKDVRCCSFYEGKTGLLRPLEGNAGSIPVARSFTYENSRFLGVES